MGASQRRKGATAERELAHLLSDALGLDCARNLEQTRSGGFDLLGVDPWALEVKRHETLQLNAWWRQACLQAERMIPALAYRKSRQPWRFRVPLPVLLGRFEGGYDRAPIAELDFDGFVLATDEVRDAQRR